ncbi:MAG: class III extradiol dioxygenase subunit B-like domain-containing protein [bacterium]
MALVFSGIAAHTPILMPKIGREEGLKLIEKTSQAMSRLEQELLAARPEIILIISPHGEMLPDAVTINISSKYVSHFDEFGDLVTKNEWKPATMLIDRIREDFKHQHLPLTLASDEQLDYGTSVPLHHLTKNLKEIRVVPFRPATTLTMKQHFEIGEALKTEILDSTSRIAVIASADLSHRVGENSPSGLSTKGVAFDDRIQELLKERNPIGLLDIDDDWTAEAQACGAGPLALLFGLIDRMSIDPEIISYEKPLGVGYLIAAIRVS